MEAVVAAKQAGKIRFIGFTGHKDPHIHLYMLNVAQAHGFHFDTVQMPINIMDAHFPKFLSAGGAQGDAAGYRRLGNEVFW